MAEPIEWLDDGTAGGSPYSPRFKDRYRSELGGLEQAQEVFLKGCGLPQAWAGQPQWCVLETGFGLGLNFLVTWAAWKADPLRPRMLHFVSTEAYPASADDVLRSAQTHPELIPFAQQLKRQLWGLLPGMHRLVFEGGQVLLTLCIGDAKAMLREPTFQADSVYLDGFSPQRNPDIWDVHTFKAVARCCRRGTRVATWTVARSVRDALAQCGFVVQKVPGTPPKRDNLQGEYNPAWEPKKTRAAPEHRTAERCIVIGSGLAGAAVAASLARRGWQVTVLDAGDTPAAGASGLMAGVLAPHVSPDDSLLSRLSRSGIRAMLQQADMRLKTGSDWSPTGVLEHCVEHARQLPAAWQNTTPATATPARTPPHAQQLPVAGQNTSSPLVEHAGQLPSAGTNPGALAQAASDWTRPATAEQLAACTLPADTPALWHVQGGWIKPARLIETWLASPGVIWRGNAAVSRLVRQDDQSGQGGASGQGQSGVWQALDAAGQLLASAELVVLASGHASQALAQTAGLIKPLALQPIRGQASWAWHPSGATPTLPPFPVNGHGSLVPAVPLADGLAWVAGSSFARDDTSTELRRADEQHNFGKLQTLLPAVAQGLAAQFETGQVQGWAGVRCATPSRLPSLGPLGSGETPDLWACCGLGSRGLSFAALCAELLAARLHGEPLPVELRQADALLPQYAPLPISGQ